MLLYWSNFTLAAKKMLKKKRTEMNLSLRQVAERLGISESFLSQIENCKRRPSPELLRNLTELLDCNLDEVSLSLGIVPRWIETILRKYPSLAIRAVNDEFKKYDRT
ncbi:helix-turn-helix domain-containing protein [Klebsiella aerogenes]|uniref:helix-turn-helix domain-containing protein n=1 Tax=Klebsiella aerogenes TaxID=548 RepID=UPI00374E1446